VGAQRHLIQDAELGETVSYTVTDAAEILGTTSKTLIARVRPTDGQRPELRGWAPKTEVNPNRSWMVDASQIDALADADVNHLQMQVAQLREELELARARTDADLEQLAAERAVVADEMATASMERSEYRQASHDAALQRIAELERERDQTRAAVKTLGTTVLELTQRLANVDI